MVQSTIGTLESLKHPEARSSQAPSLHLPTNPSSPDRTRIRPGRLPSSNIGEQHTIDSTHQNEKPRLDNGSNDPKMAERHGLPLRHRSSIAPTGQSNSPMAAFFMPGRSFGPANVESALPNPKTTAKPGHGSRRSQLEVAIRQQTTTNCMPSKPPTIESSFKLETTIHRITAKPFSVNQWTGVSPGQHQNPSTFGDSLLIFLDCMTIAY